MALFQSDKIDFEVLLTILPIFVIWVAQKRDKNMMVILFII